MTPCSAPRPLEGLAQSTLPLLPLPRSAYKEVIEGPARAFANAGGKLAIEPQLTQRLLDGPRRRRPAATRCRCSPSRSNSSFSNTVAPVR